MFEVVYNGDIERTPITEILSGFFEKQFNENKETMYLDADIMSATGMRDTWLKHPDRVVNCGIQEANMVGVAGGMSLLGLKPYVHSFAAFITRRAFDQIFLSIAYADKSIHILGTEPGIRNDYNGGTHIPFEDVAIMRTVPNAQIFDITDNASLLSILEQTKDEHGVFYYRLPLAEIQKVYSAGSEVTAGKGNILHEGEDVSIIACGLLVGKALDAADMLEKKGFSARVVDMFTLKPLDKDLIIDSAKKTGAILTAENAAIYGV